MKGKRRYYDPGKNPYPTRKEKAEWGTKVSGGPTGNSRQQRRARARLTWLDQYALAKAEKFPVPDKTDIPESLGGPDQFIGAKTAIGWIKTWEDRYADR